MCLRRIIDLWEGDGGTENGDRKKGKEFWGLGIRYWETQVLKN